MRNPEHDNQRQPDRRNEPSPDWGNATTARPAKRAEPRPAEREGPRPAEREGRGLSAAAARRLSRCCDDFAEPLQIVLLDYPPPVVAGSQPLPECVSPNYPGNVLDGFAGLGRRQPLDDACRLGGCPIRQLCKRVDFHAGIVPRQPRPWKPAPRPWKPAVTENFFPLRAILVDTRRNHCRIGTRRDDDRIGSNVPRP